MSRNYKSRDVSLSNKFYMITDPVHRSDMPEFDDDETDYRWLAKSRRLQARRWRKIKQGLA